MLLASRHLSQTHRGEMLLVILRTCAVVHHLTHILTHETEIFERGLGASSCGERRPSSSSILAPSISPWLVRGHLLLSAK